MQQVDIDSGGDIPSSKGESHSPSEIESDTSLPDDGIWVGIDLGTSNCACAVWDSTRGSPKWIRLPKVASLQSDGKMGRVMPSVVRWVFPKDRLEQQKGLSLTVEEEAQVFVGAPALQRSTTDNVEGVVFQSVKRLLGKQYDEVDSKLLESLDFDVLPPLDQDDREGAHGPLRLIPRNLESTTFSTTPEKVLSKELKALKLACQSYLDRFHDKKNLKIPGFGLSLSKKSSETVENVVVGVPAHFSNRHKSLIEQACRDAGFHGYVGTCLESTAAAMAYGLTLQETSNDATIMVIDMGGGTTDITIVTKSDNDSNSASTVVRQTLPTQSAISSHDSFSYQVLVTRGDEALGGDDIDQAIVEYCVEKSRNTELSSQLLAMCRRSKEALCSIKDPQKSFTIVVGKGKATITITQESFEQIIQPWLQRAKDVILKSRKDLEEISSGTKQVNEVVLVGGTTQIPAVRKMIRDIFPTIELCTSLNPMSSVAQGLAIQAAIISRKVPLHELKSALMLDSVPHAIGVLLPGNDEFVQVIPRNTPLPAKGIATFTLADKHQAGVTIRAVEKVGENAYEPLSRDDFTFLLRRLTPRDLDKISWRKVQVGMMVDVDGKFVVSVFDEHDPEQVRKRNRFESIQSNQEVVGELTYIADLIMAELGMSFEQIMLSLALVGVFLAYVAVKVAFSNPTDGGGTILG